MMSAPKPSATTLPIELLRRVWATARHAVMLMHSASQAATIAAEKQALEAQLARERDEWNAGLLRLAHALDMDAHETRQALIRESFRAVQTSAPDQPSGS